MGDRFHRFENIDVGEESASGKAVRVKIGGDWIWVPMSVVTKIKRNGQTTENDELIVEEWWARKNGYA